MDQLAKDVRVEDIQEKSRNGEPNLWREVAEQFGPEIVVFIASRAGGESLRVPSLKVLLSPAISRYKISCKYSGKSPSVSF